MGRETVCLKEWGTVYDFPKLKYYKGIKGSHLAIDNTIFYMYKYYPYVAQSPLCMGI